ncbi:MAG: hypothetical protein HY716_11375 [Planctomycetes bacterium]|nr:hypothetical protein [Planctomycetota bacterium]
MDEWKIDRRRRGCAGCGKAFASEEPHFSAIRWAGGRFERVDACEPCWKEFLSTWEDPPYSYWMSRAPKKEKRRLEDVNSLTEFFKRLVERRQDSLTYDKVLYLTSLLLMRKRRVKPVGTRRSEERSWIVLEKAWDGEMVEIPDPPISNEELHALTDELERLFALEVGGGPAVEEGADTPGIVG